MGDRSRATARATARRHRPPRPSTPPPLPPSAAPPAGFARVRPFPGLGSDARDTSPSVPFHGQSPARLQRRRGLPGFAVEQGVTLRRLAAPLTRVGSHTSGGLVGMLLTMADGALEHREDEPELAVHGPPRVERLRAAVDARERPRRALSRAFPLTTRLEPIRTTSETSDDKGSGGGAPNGGGGTISLPKPALEDDVCVVTPVVVAPRRFAESARDGTEGPAGPFGRLISDATTPEGSDEPNKRRKLVSTSASTAASAFALDPRDAESVIYDVQLRGMPGKFDAKEAERLGVPRGKLRAALVRRRPPDDGRGSRPDVAAPTRRARGARRRRADGGAPRRGRRPGEFREQSARGAWAAAPRSRAWGTTRQVILPRMRRRRRRREGEPEPEPEPEPERK